MSKYSIEFKIKFIKIYLEANIDIEKLAEKYNISHLEIRRWTNSYQIQKYELLKAERKNTRASISSNSSI
jgi:IS1223 family transposase ISLasa1b